MERTRSWKRGKDKKLSLPRFASFSVLDTNSDTVEYMLLQFKSLFLAGLDGIITVRYSANFRIIRNFLPTASTIQAVICIHTFTVNLFIILIEIQAVSFWRTSCGSWTFPIWIFWTTPVWTGTITSIWTFFVARTF